MRRILFLVLSFLFVLILSACSDKYRSVDEFYGKMQEIRDTKSNGIVYHVSVETDSDIKNYKVYTKKNKIRIETLDPSSYLGYNNLTVNNGLKYYTYNPFTRNSIAIFDEQEKKSANPLQFLINWGENDAGYLNNLYKFGKKTRRNDFQCKTLQNIDAITKKNGFEYCINEEYGVAVYLKVPCVREGESDGKACQTVTNITKIEEIDIPDYLFELPSDAGVVK